jgi:hypothetical protein
LLTAEHDKRRNKRKGKVFTKQGSRGADGRGPIRSVAWGILVVLDNPISGTFVRRGGWYPPDVLTTRLLGEMSCMGARSSKKGGAGRPKSLAALVVGGGEKRGWATRP